MSPVLARIVSEIGQQIAVRVDRLGLSTDENAVVS
jgi:hypothetical protein